MSEGKTELNENFRGLKTILIPNILGIIHTYHTKLPTQHFRNNIYVRSNYVCSPEIGTFFFLIDHKSMNSDGEQARISLTN